MTERNKTVDFIIKLLLRRYSAWLRPALIAELRDHFED